MISERYLDEFQVGERFQSQTVTLDAPFELKEA